MDANRRLSEESEAKVKAVLSEIILLMQGRGLNPFETHRVINGMLSTFVANYAKKEEDVQLLLEPILNDVVSFWNFVRAADAKAKAGSK